MDVTQTLFNIDFLYVPIQKRTSAEYRNCIGKNYNGFLHLMGATKGTTRPDVWPEMDSPGIRPSGNLNQPTKAMRLRVVYQKQWRQSGFSPMAVVPGCFTHA